MSPPAHQAETTRAPQATGPTSYASPVEEIPVSEARFPWTRRPYVDQR
jgi:hypothetical protein